METKQPKARILALYLPQFHPIPENDQWWGKGFTEWTNVGKAKPLFPGHYQPHVPADLGYYDLRVPETREAQAQMAREAGIEGFVYWHYWFGNGKRLLERPFNEVLESNKPDFPFALAWANETWAGFAHGLSDYRETLIEQTYPGDEDYIAHFNALLPAFKDKRYITCEGKPIFIIYKPLNLPDGKHFIELWQKLARENGLEGIYFIAHAQAVAKNIVQYRKDRIEEGYNAVQPTEYIVAPREMPLWLHIIRSLFHKNKRFRLIPSIAPYDMKAFHTELDTEENVFPTVTPNWDHTPRTGKNGSVLYNSSPLKFQKAMEYALNTVINKPFDKRFIIIKSWNEWAEGNHLEPDLKYGHAWLDAIKNVVLK